MTSTTSAVGLNQTTSSGIYQGTVVASGVFVAECIVIVGLIVGIIILLCYHRYRKTHKPDLATSTTQLVTDPDLVMDTQGRDNLAIDVEEGGGEEDAVAYDVSRLRKPTGAITQDQVEVPIMDGNPDILSNVKTNDEHRDNPDVNEQPNDFTNTTEFINALVENTNEDPQCPPYDIPVIFTEEGPSPYELDTLSSISDMSNLSEDIQFDYLNDWGPKFGKLSNLYADEDD